MNCDGKPFLDMVNSRLTRWVTDDEILNEFKMALEKVTLL